jgi:hypothetical protein
MSFDLMQLSVVLSIIMLYRQIFFCQLLFFPLSNQNRSVLCPDSICLHTLPCHGLVEHKEGLFLVNIQIYLASCLRFDNAIKKTFIDTRSACPTVTNWTCKNIYV